MVKEVSSWRRRRKRLAGHPDAVGAIITPFLPDPSWCFLAPCLSAKVPRKIMNDPSCLRSLRREVTRGMATTATALNVLLRPEINPLGWVLAGPAILQSGFALFLLTVLIPGSLLRPSLVLQIVITVLANPDWGRYFQPLDFGLKTAAPGERNVGLRLISPSRSFFSIRFLFNAKLSSPVKQSQLCYTICV